MLPVLMAAGCGTILYPERRGQPPGRLDWGVVALNGIGLVFFFVPGVIAFAVDFITGAIYLPPDEYYGAESQRPSRLRRIDVPREQLTRTDVARIVSDAAGHSITLDPNTYHTRALKQLDDFWETRDALAATATGVDPASAVRAQSPWK